MAKAHIARPTAIGLAFKAAAEAKGYDTSNARMPLKREAQWSVTRRQKKKGRR